MRVASVNFKFGDWLEHEDGRRGIAQRWGTWDWETRTGTPTSRRLALASPEPAVEVFLPSHELVWWPLSEIEGPVWPRPEVPL